MKNRIVADAIRSLVHSISVCIRFRDWVVIMIKMIFFFLKFGRFFFLIFLKSLKTTGLFSFHLIEPSRRVYYAVASQTTRQHMPSIRTSLTPWCTFVRKTHSFDFWDDFNAQHFFILFQIWYSGAKRKLSKINFANWRVNRRHNVIRGGQLNVVSYRNIRTLICSRNLLCCKLMKLINK